MKIVHLSSLHFSVSINRQTPKNDGCWGDMVTRLEDSHGDANWLVVYDRHAEPTLTKAPKERRILMVSEPPEFQNYRQDYLDQFGTLVAPYPIANFKGRQIITQTGLPWFYGMTIGGGGAADGNTVSKAWDELAGPAPSLSGRTMEITAICSTKTQTKNQIRRLRFLRMLKAELGENLRIFGRGFERLDDKAVVIEKSRYHLALENNLSAHGWTEKTADAILGGAFPIHGGSETIYEDFDKDGILWIDLTRPRDAVRKVKSCIESNRIEREETQTAMRANKARLMDQHNLFAVIARCIEEIEPECRHVPQLENASKLHWQKSARLKRMLKMPRPLKRLVWKAQIALFERS